MLGIFLFPIALALLYLGAAILLTSMALLYINKYKRNQKLKVLASFCIIIGLISLTPMVLQRGISTLESSYYTGLAHEQMGPFAAAVDSNDYDKVKGLIDKGADVNAEFHNYQEITPLILAVHNSSYEMVKFLLKNGADINREAGKNFKTTPLLEAVYSDNSRNKDDIKMVKLLLENGADVNKRSGKKQQNVTALEHSAWYSLDPEVMRVLLKYKSNPNIDNGSPLRVVIYSGTRLKEFNRLDFVKVLVENGADVNVSDEAGITPLHLAVNSHNVDMIKYLIEHKADINEKDSEGRTPLITMCLAANNGNSKGDKRVEILKVLLENGADINIKDKSGRTALDYVKTKDYTKAIADYLIKNGAK